MTRFGHNNNVYVVLVQETLKRGDPALRTFVIGYKFAPGLCVVWPQGWRRWWTRRAGLCGRIRSRSRASSNGFGGVDRTDAADVLMIVFLAASQLSFLLQEHKVAGNGISLQESLFRGCSVCVCVGDFRLNKGRGRKRQKNKVPAVAVRNNRLLLLQRGMHFYTHMFILGRRLEMSKAGPP